MREGRDERTLKSSRRYQLNTSPTTITPSSTTMRREEFSVGDLVLADFPGCSWPALVTGVTTRHLQVVTLISEQEETVTREHAHLFKGSDHLRQKLSTLTPGQRHEFADAEAALKTMSRMNREERMEHMRCRKQPGEEGVGSAGGGGFKENVRKLPCDVDDITLDGSHLEQIMNGKDGHPASHNSPPEIPSQMRGGVDPGAAAAASSKISAKQQRDESYIVSTMEQINKLHQIPAPVSLPPPTTEPSPNKKPQEEHTMSKLLTDHLKATRAAQKKALKIHANVTFEIVQTTERNPSKRGRKPGVAVLRTPLIDQEHPSPTSPSLTRTDSQCPEGGATPGGCETRTLPPSTPNTPRITPQTITPQTSPTVLLQLPSTPPKGTLLCQITTHHPHPNNKT
eukprot:sb/3465439/